MLWYRRDASWTANTGRAQPHPTKFHRMHPTHVPMALCAPTRIALLDDDGFEEESPPETSRCTRCVALMRPSKATLKLAEQYARLETESEYPDMNAAIKLARALLLVVR